MKIAVIGSLNIDTTVVTDNLPEKGETILGTDLYQSFGGKGANQAIAAARVGGSVSMVGCVGKDSNGQSYLDQLSEEGIDISLIDKVEVPTGSALITVAKQGSNTIVVYPGANNAITKQQIDSQWDKISESEILVLQFEIPMEIIEYVVEKASKEQKTIIVNPAPYQKISDKVLSLLTYLTPNETELEKLSQTSDVDEGIQKLLDKGVKNLVVTLGDKGCVWANNNEKVYFKGYRVKAIDTTAAGDCFNGAFAVALTKFQDKQEILKFANQAAALSVMKKGAVPSLPTLKEIELNKELFK